MELDPQFTTPPEIAGLVIIDPPVLTQLADVAAAGALLEAYRFVFGFDLSRRALCCLLAQCLLETGNFQHCWCNNWGNVKASDLYPGASYFIRCNEVIDGKIVWFLPYNPGCRFRAFRSAAVGAEQYIRFLGTATNAAGKPNRYAKAWDAAMAGDPVSFVAELAAARYFTASVALYQAAVQKIFTYLLANLPSDIAAPPHEHDPIVFQPTSGHSPLTDADVDRILSLQLPLTIDWDELRKQRDQEILAADLG